MPARYRVRRARQGWTSSPRRCPTDSTPISALPERACRAASASASASRAPCCRIRSCWSSTRPRPRWTPPPRRRSPPPSTNCSAIAPASSSATARRRCPAPTSCCHSTPAAPAPPMAEADPAPVRIGILDSGVDLGRLPVAGQASFADEVDIAPEHGEPDHGTAVADIVLSRAPDAVIVSARVFRGRRPASAQVVASGLDWLVEQRVHAVNMSFGLVHDRNTLREACRKAIEAGVLLVAAAPAAGAMTFPAAYPGVIRVTGDARLAPGELSFLGDSRADFGAAAGGPAHRPHTPGGGASLAAAHFTGELARVIAAGAAGGDAVELLRRECRYVGRERRGSR